MIEAKALPERNPKAWDAMIPGSEARSAPACPAGVASNSGHLREARVKAQRAHR